MPAVPHARWDVGGCICVTDNGEGSNVLGAPAETGGMTRVQIVSSSRIAADTSS